MKAKTNTSRRTIKALRGHWLPLLLFCTYLLQCCHLPESKIITTSPAPIKHYIFLGHTYDWQAREANRVDPRIEKIGLDTFDQIWLGGDICTATTRDSNTLDYLDSLFHISDESTCWSVGNHDFREGNTQYITRKTGRPLYYLTHHDSLSVLVINGMMEHSFYKDSCDYKAGQLAFLTGALEHLPPSTHLVVLAHPILWDNVVDPPLLDARSSANAAASWMDLTCQKPSEFKDVLYPKLVEWQKRGVQVLLLTGDGGQYDKAYYHRLDNGIELFISGINNSFDFSHPDRDHRIFNQDPDSILIFTHDLRQHKLTGKFVQLNEYIAP